ncbi:MAG TPA: helix-turn-helix transcriptional regulator [Candidatus Dormibacteraeota bacterium]|nr:helix-turn-helix transcriptional regulator [Candidatus Dormibacteraeota bacterium]
MSPPPTQFQTVIRRNLRRLRTKLGWRQEDLAQRARARGLSWAASTVTAIEIGRRPVSAAELLVLPTLLKVPLTELLAAEKDEVADVEGVLVTKAALDQIARGRPLEERESEFFVTPPRVEASATEAERKAARNLSQATNSTVTVPDLIAMAQLQWEGRRLDEERERRLKTGRRRGSLARQRGHITAQLQKELLEKLTHTKTRPASSVKRLSTRRSAGTNR